MAFQDQAAPWRELYQYWRDKHVDGRPPSRRDIDPPLEIPRMLKNLVIIEVSADKFLLRLVGSEIARYVKADGAGDVAWVRVWSSNDIIKTWLALLKKAAVTQKPQLVVSRFPTGVKAFSQSLALPLVDASGRTEQILIGVFRGGYIDLNIEVEGIETREVIHPDDDVE